MAQLFSGLLRVLLAPQATARPEQERESLSLEPLEQRNLPSVSTPVLPHLPKDVLVDIRSMQTAVTQYEQRVDELVEAMINHPKQVGHVTEVLNIISLQTVRLQHRIDALTGDLAQDNRLTDAVKADVGMIGGATDQFAAQVDEDKSLILADLQTHTNGRPDMRSLRLLVDHFEVSMNHMVRDTILGIQIPGATVPGS